jgi:hypothetical protein
MCVLQRQCLQLVGCCCKNAVQPTVIMKYTPSIYDYLLLMNECILSYSVLLSRNKQIGLTTTMLTKNICYDITVAYSTNKQVHMG